MTIKVAIIGGAGRMGQWFARYLSNENFEVIIADDNPERLKEASHRLGIPAFDTKNAIKQADVVLLSVPIIKFESVVKEVSLYVRNGQIIIDITSTKQMPVTVMHRYIKVKSILGSHPLFGPGAKGITDMNFILTPTNEEEHELAQKATDFLESRGAHVSLMTPEEHDEMITVILGLSHYIALVAADTLSDLSTIQKMKNTGSITYKVLITLIESVLSEDPAFYASLQMSLPKLPQIQQRFQNNAAQWAELVKTGDNGKFVARMKKLKEIFEKDISFGGAYEEMYEIAQSKLTYKKSLNEPQTH